MALSRAGKLLRYASAVKQGAGKSYLQQLTEILSLASGRQRLGLSEYFELGVFDDNDYPARRKLDCVGWRASAEIDRQLNSDYWRATANDKVMNYALLQHYGFPLPQTFATYSPQGRRVASELSLSTRDQLEDFLLNDVQFPVFIKPVHGSYGRGTYSLVSCDTSTGLFIDAHGGEVQLADLVNTCLTRQFNGMLFQERLQPHDAVQALIGNTTSCVRAIVVQTADGPRLHMAFWKVARTHNITDNFCMGETGNLLAWVNKESGTVERVVTGLWPEGKEVTHHPDTKQQLLGWTLPDWQKALAMCLSAATHFPGLRLQNWDIAFCRQGPVLMELNTEADLGVPQYLGRTPFVDSTIQDMIGKA